MKLDRPTRRTQSETIVALIDVVFFLLVFFMLIGRMDASSPFDVMPAQALTGSDMPAGGTTLSIGAEGQIALDGREMEAPQALERLKSRLADNPAILVRVNAHRDSKLSELMPLVAQVEKLGAKDVMLVVTPDTGQ